MVHSALVITGVTCRSPSGGFYLYPDFEKLRPALGAIDGDGLAELLLERFGIAVLPGSAFGDDPAALRFRLATSLLHGDTDDERRSALADPEPAGRRRVREAVEALEAAIASIREGECA
jgi:aspartate aminotransferase